MQGRHLVRITAMRAHGCPYRWWDALLERSTAAEFVTFVEAGSSIYQPDQTWNSRVHGRSFYWAERPFNVTESYTEDGTSG